MEHAPNTPHSTTLCSTPPGGLTGGLDWAKTTAPTPTCWPTRCAPTTPGCAP